MVVVPAGGEGDDSDGQADAYETQRGNFSILVVFGDGECRDTGQKIDIILHGWQLENWRIVLDDIAPSHGLSTFGKKPHERFSATYYYRTS